MGWAQSTQAAQLGTKLHRVGCGTYGVVLVGERPAARLNSTLCIVANGLELPDAPNAFEIAYMGAVGQVHTVHVGVDSAEYQQGHGAEWVVECSAKGNPSTMGFN